MLLEELKEFHSQVRVLESSNKKFNDKDRLCLANQSPKSKEITQVPRFAKYTPLNIKCAYILEEALIVELIPTLRKIITSLNVNQSKHYWYHRNCAHNIEVCFALKDKIKIIQVSHLQRLILRNKEEARHYPKINQQRENRREERRDKIDLFPQ